MTSSLPPDRLEQLLPCLARVADLMCQHGQVTLEQARILLIGLDLSEEEWAELELRRWIKILNAVQGVLDPATKEAAIQALMLRGIPLAPAELAVHRVSAPDPMHVAPITISKSAIDFGQLHLGQTSQTTLTVAGGPGRVSVTSSLISVEPESFGPEETLLTVQVTGELTEQILWGYVILESKTEQKQVQVTAHWTDQFFISLNSQERDTWTEDVSRGLVYYDLAEAIVSSPPETKLRLSEGTHCLTEPLLVDKAIILEGAGVEATLVVCEEGDCVIRFSGNGFFKVDGISFVHRGRKWTDVAIVEDGCFEIVNCRFSGGVLDNSAKFGGSGLVLRGSANGLVKGCIFSENESNGIEITCDAQPTIESNVCKSNHGCGIIYLDRSSGECKGNLCLRNGKHGICVRHEASPQLENNKCEQNRLCGIAYLERSLGVSRKNICVGNEMDGICVEHKSRPNLQDNTCEQNQRHGIACFGETRIVMRKNKCIGNKQDGIHVHSQANPTIKDNVSKYNKRHNVYFQEKQRFGR